MSVNFEWHFVCYQELLISNDYEFLRIDGTTKANDRVKIVNVRDPLTSNQD